MQRLQSSPTKRRPASNRSLPTPDELLRQSGGTLPDRQATPVKKPARVRKSQEAHFMLYLERQSKSMPTVTTTDRTTTSMAGANLPQKAVRTSLDVAVEKSVSATMPRYRAQPATARARAEQSSEEVSGSHSEMALNAASGSSGDTVVTPTPPTKAKRPAPRGDRQVFVPALALEQLRAAPPRVTGDTHRRLDKATLKNVVRNGDVLILLKSVFLIRSARQPDFSRTLHSVLNNFSAKQRDALVLLRHHKSMDSSSAMKGWAEFLDALIGCLDFVHNYAERTLLDSREGSGEDLLPCCRALMFTREFSNLFAYVQANPNLYLS